MALSKITANGTNFSEASTGLTVPNGTTAERPVSPNSGIVRYNSTTDRLESYYETSWFSIDGGAQIANEQIFTANGTWTKPSGFDANDSVIVVAIGGGGSGAASSVSSSTSVALAGGNGGGVFWLKIRYDLCPSSVTVTVGAGGAAANAVFSGGVGSTVSGANGSNSTFGTYLTAAFGRGGSTAAQTQENDPSSLTFLTSTSTFPPGGNSLQRTFGGVVGGRGRYVDTANNQSTDYPRLTGGGGGVSNSSTTFRTASVTGIKGTVYGEGGDAGNSADGSPGTSPGGGGGASRKLASGHAVSGAGGAGEVRVYVCRGNISPSSLIPYAADF